MEKISKTQLKIPSFLLSFFFDYLKKFPFLVTMATLNEGRDVRYNFKEVVLKIILANSFW